MKEYRIASRYARSILGLAVEQGVQEAVYHDMQLVSSVCEQNRDFVVMLKSPLIKADQKQAVLTNIFGSKVHKLTITFFDILTRKKREDNLDAIAQEYVNIYKKGKGIETAIVTSAVGLDDTLRQQVIKIVQQSTRAEVELVEKVDKDLIGGFILRVGDMQYDTTIARSLRRLKKDFNTNPYIKKQ